MVSETQPLHETSDALGLLIPCVSLMEPAASAKTPSLAWKWILEKLLDIPNFGLPFLDGLFYFNRICCVKLGLEMMLLWTCG